MPRATPVVPLPRSAQDAIEGSSTLQQLLARRQQALARYRVVASLVPPELRDHVFVGGLDEQRWTLLVEGAAAASKLRQLLPAFEAALRNAALAEPPLVLRVKAR